MGQIGGTLLRVLVSPGGGWDVKEPGSSAAILVHRDTEAEAVEAAQVLLSGGGTIHVFDGEGFPQQTLQVAPRGGSRSAPWWYQSPGVSLAFLLLGVTNLVPGLLRIVFRRTGDTMGWLAVLQVIGGVALVAMAAVSRRLHRRFLRTAVDRLEAARRSET